MIHYFKNLLFSHFNLGINYISDDLITDIESLNLKCNLICNKKWLNSIEVIETDLDFFDAMHKTIAYKQERKNIYKDIFFTWEFLNPESKKTLDDLIISHIQRIDEINNRPNSIYKIIERIEDSVDETNSLASCYGDLDSCGRLLYVLEYAKRIEKSCYSNSVFIDAMLAFIESQLIILNNIKECDEQFSLSGILDIQNHLTKLRTEV